MPAGYRALGTSDQHCAQRGTWHLVAQVGLAAWPLPAKDYGLF